jgi:hypothetical protein
VKTSPFRGDAKLLDTPRGWLPWGTKDRFDDRVCERSELEKIGHLGVNMTQEKMFWVDSEVVDHRDVGIAIDTSFEKNITEYVRNFLKVTKLGVVTTIVIDPDLVVCFESRNGDGFFAMIICVVMFSTRVFEEHDNLHWAFLGGSDPARAWGFSSLGLLFST